MQQDINNLLWKMFFFFWEWYSAPENLEILTRCYLTLNRRNKNFKIILKNNLALFFSVNSFDIRSEPEYRITTNIFKLYINTHWQKMFFYAIKWLFDRFIYITLKNYCQTIHGTY